MAPNSVPKSHQVIPGAHVNIVLKADQPTGRQVQGTVQNVLTRGDHHRGIKVRLTDGRIGRVQSMSLRPDGDSSTQTLPGTSSASHLTSSFSLMPSAPENGGESRGQGRRPRYRDVRLEEQLDEAPEQIDLGAYIVPSRRKRKAKKGPNAGQGDDSDNPEVSPRSNGRQTAQDFSSVTVTCPVCGEFEGDEAAVGHHVAEHFGA